MRETINAFEECGLVHYNEMIYLNQIGTLPIRTSGSFISGRKVGKNHQNIICMFKGNPKELKPLSIEGNDFTPLVELENKPLNKVVEKNEPRVIEFLEDKVEDKVEEIVVKTICEVCGVDYQGSTREEHEARRFHQDYV